MVSCPRFGGFVLPIVALLAACVSGISVSELLWASSSANLVPRLPLLPTLPGSVLELGTLAGTPSLVDLDSQTVLAAGFFTGLRRTAGATDKVLPTCMYFRPCLPDRDVFTTYLNWARAGVFFPMLATLSTSLMLPSAEEPKVDFPAKRPM